MVGGDRGVSGVGGCCTVALVWMGRCWSFGMSLLSRMALDTLRCLNGRRGVDSVEVELSAGVVIISSEALISENQFAVSLSRDEH